MGKRHVGKIEMADGSIFEGNFENGRQIAWSTYPSGDRYEGSFKDGKEKEQEKLFIKMV